MTDVRAHLAEHATDTTELALFLAMLGLDEPQPATTGRPRYGTQGCGTRAGFQRHRDRAQTPCDACADAQRTYMRDYQRKRYTPERRRAQYEAAKARGYYAKESA